MAIAVADDDQWAALRSSPRRPAWAARPRAGDDGGTAGATTTSIDAALAAWCAERHGGRGRRPAVVRPACRWRRSCTRRSNSGFEQLEARRFFETVHHPISGESVHVTFPFRLPGEDGPVHRRPAPTLGQHNDEVLRELLGLSDAEIAGLREAGVIGESLGGLAIRQAATGCGRCSTAVG